MATSGAAGEDDLTDLKRLVLQAKRHALVKDVNPIKFLPYLRSKFVVDAYESDMIKNCCARSIMEGAGKLIDVLCTKGGKGYDEFCMAILHEETQIHLLKALNKELEARKHDQKQQRTQDTLKSITPPSVHKPVISYNPSPNYRVSTNKTVPGSAHTTSCIEYVAQPPTPDFMCSRSPHPPNTPVGYQPPPSRYQPAPSGYQPAPSGYYMTGSPSVGYHMANQQGAFSGGGVSMDDRPCGQPIQ